MGKKGVSWNILFLVLFVWLSYLYMSDWVWFLDDMLHAMGGVILCSFALWDSRKETMSLWTRSLLCLGFIALMSVFWEAGWYYFQEATVEHLDRFAKDDIISDFLYALLGGVFRYSWYVYTTERS